MESSINALLFSEKHSRSGTRAVSTAHSWSVEGFVTSFLILRIQSEAKRGAYEAMDNGTDEHFLIVLISALVSHIKQGSETLLFEEQEQVEPRMASDKG